ncbi:hypothetical protein [Massilia timonae]|uniref:hypothetical protein n=1 Tax=Massilia timonae TaxID=47229 RepID=UPI0028995B91|nr:hypothetical protein [Massilia timonae]
MKRTALPVIGVCLLLGACASTPAYINPPYDVIERTEETGSVPAIGVASQAATGDNMYAEFQTTSKRTINVTLLAPASAVMDLGHKLALPAGRTGRLGTTTNGGFPAMCFFHVTEPGIGGPAHACTVDTDRDGAFDSAMFMNRDRLFPLAAPAKYKTEKSAPEVTREESGGFRREILYQGVSKGTIKLSFREFMNDMARPAFTQEILYDLEQDGTAIVVFKGLRLKVLQATGMGVRYVVEQPFAGR